MAVADQLINELSAACRPLRAILGEEVEESLGRAIKESHGTIMARLKDSDEGRKLAEQLFTFLGPVGLGWWGTALGRLIGPLLPDEGVSQEWAATVLGVKRGTVAVLVTRGTLQTIEADSSGKPGKPTNRQLSRHSVIKRLTRLHPDAS